MRNLFRSLFKKTAAPTEESPQLKLLLIHQNLNLSSNERNELIKRLQDTLHDFILRDSNQTPALVLLREEKTHSAK